PATPAATVAPAHGGGREWDRRRASADSRLEWQRGDRQRAPYRADRSGPYRSPSSHERARTSGSTSRHWAPRSTRYRLACAEIKGDTLLFGHSHARVGMAEVYSVPKRLGTILIGRLAEFGDGTRSVPATTCACYDVCLLRRVPATYAIWYCAGPR